MNTSILNDDIQEFIRLNESTDVRDLALRMKAFSGVAAPAILNQIACRSKAKDKLPSWYKTDKIIYPSRVSLEQTSSERTAAYKAALVSGESLMDLTGGFGVDAFYFAKSVKNVTHCEIQADLSEIASHNFQQLSVSNITCIAQDGLEFLIAQNKQYDWIYVDPARRNNHQGKVFRLSDCTPDVLHQLSEYFRYSAKVLIKTSPLLDLTAGLRDLRHVKEVHVVAVRNEVKELLWVLQANFSGTTKVVAANLSDSREETLSYLWPDTYSGDWAQIGHYLYEPNAAIMKAGAFEAVRLSYNLKKLHPLSHLFTSEQLINFPGRRFQVKEVLPYGKEPLKKVSALKTANITVRNFPETVEELRKRTRLRDGGSDYLFFTTTGNQQKLILLCEKI